ncbi:phage-related lysozyme (muraminidase) [Clostridium sp. ASBs410]|nr:phage-related lysozyme (muraminidase) [Clostridium sp. ASBs410]
MADLKDTYVVHGACSTCTHGMRESKIVLERTHGVFLKDRALMTINDCKPENIICFGGCYSLENPDTAAEAQKVQMAVEKDCPNTFTDTVMNFFTKKDQKESSEAPLQVVGICNPRIISAEWDNGGNTVEVNGEVPLLAGAKVHCLYGGEIEIIDSGQPEAGDMSQVEISPHSVPLSGSPGGNSESAAMGAAAAGIAATPGMPKQAVAGMIGASVASGYGKKEEENTAVEEPGNYVFQGDEWLALAEGNLPFIYSTKDISHKPWTGAFDPSADLTFGIGHSIKTADEFNSIKKFIETHTDSEITDEVQKYLQKDMASAVERVNNFSKNNNVVLKQNQFDAIVSLVFNYPTSLANGSTLYDALIKGDYSKETIIEGFTYTKFQNKRIDGLVTRRNNELNLFFKADYDHYYDTKQKVIDARINHIKYE